ncbi:MAG: SDR family NAD(P)-dependent oxidoreductase, partial [Acidimicrobiia bacterium]|nr:SDR family NAD(P)-dependent oxidoreductase [Acidimicrobiia bacterium]
MSGRLSGKVAVVTGAGQGIGAAIARLFAEEGARLVLADLAGERVAVVAKEIVSNGGKAEAVRADVTSDSDCRAMIEA